MKTLKWALPALALALSTGLATAQDWPRQNVKILVGSSPGGGTDAMARAIRAALGAHQGDILAFLPGMAEIRRTEAALSGCGALVLPLHGELPPAEQDRALRPAPGAQEGGRRVVLVFCMRSENVRDAI